METPSIVLNGEEIKAKRPSMKAWRTVEAFNDKDKMDMPIAEFVSECIGILSVVYGRDVSEIEEGIDVSDVIPAYREAVSWVHGLAFEKLGKVKNGETAADEND